MYCVGNIVLVQSGFHTIDCTSNENGVWTLDDLPNLACYGSKGSTGIEKGGTAHSAGEFSIFQLSIGIPAVLFYF